MKVPDSTLHLAGLALGHAAWSVSDLAAGEALAPIAFVRRGQDLQLMRFEADTQELAIQGGRAALEKQQSALDAWAFAREGLMDVKAFDLKSIQSSEEGKIDVLAIDAWSHEMPEPVTLIQPFQPFSTGTFLVPGEALVVIQGQGVEGGRAARMRALLYEGVLKHEKVAPLWKRWRAA